MDGNSNPSRSGSPGRLGWLVAASVLLYGGALWAFRDLPLPGFAVRVPRQEDRDRGFLVETAPASPAVSRPARPASPEAGPNTAQAPARPAARSIPASALEPGVSAPAAASSGTGLASVPARDVRGGAGDGAPRASVFTVTIPTARLVYLIDVSGSMFGPLAGPGRAAAQNRFEAATEEVRRSIRLLPPDVAFNVILFGDKPVAMAPAPVAALPEAKLRAEAFLSRLPDVGGGTDLVAGMGAALKMSPDSIFLLTDGGANEPDWKLLQEVRGLEEAASTPSRLYAFGMAPQLDDDGDRLLQKICLMSGGTYQPMADWKKGANP